MLAIKFRCSECNKVQTDYFDSWLDFDVTGDTKWETWTTIECECEDCFHQNEIRIDLQALESYMEVAND